MPDSDDDKIATWRIQVTLGPKGARVRTGHKPARYSFWRRLGRSLVRSCRNAAGDRAGYAGCGRCGDTFDWTEWHITKYQMGRGMFPLCEDCWASLTPEGRLPFYVALVLTNAKTTEPAPEPGRVYEECRIVAAAVLEGK